MRFVLLESSQLPSYLPLFSLSADGDGDGVGQVVARNHYAAADTPAPRRK
jgi:hypothetical protein